MALIYEKGRKQEELIAEDEKGKCFLFLIEYAFEKTNFYNFNNLFLGHPILEIF